MKTDFERINDAIRERNKQKRRFRIEWHGLYITLYELKFHGWEYFGIRDQRSLTSPKTPRDGHL